MRLWNKSCCFRWKVSDLVCWLYGGLVFPMVKWLMVLSFRLEDEAFLVCRNWFWGSLWLLCCCFLVLEVLALMCIFCFYGTVFSPPLELVDCFGLAGILLGKKKKKRAKLNDICPFFFFFFGKVICYFYINL